MTQTPHFTIGIEEEYLLVDARTCALMPTPDALMADLVDALGDRVTSEFLNCQVEVGTDICNTIADARADLGHLRSTVARLAQNYGLRPIAASCHPFADWKQQNRTDKPRYNQLDNDLGAVARRMLIGGMHVHVGLPDKDMRISLMNQLSYFLPHLLALSASSPFWQGRDTGLASYRMTVFDSMPRTGLPPRMAGWAMYQRRVQTLVDLGVIEDATKIWWDLRPSANFPTLETRICDVSPRMENTLTLAAVIQALVRMLWRRTQDGKPWRETDPLIVSENRWRAQRYGVSEGLIDSGENRVVPFAELMEDLLDLIGEDIDALNSRAEATRVRDIAAQGTDADRQRRVRQQALDKGADDHAALCAVVHALADVFCDY
ncbi:carboxylate-amine ligase [Loktanella sp. SALINAS62]|uniref:carboxylate-amine ligase n=1 Tax=Loktanella sp. SALINAS62 TaxID=2706124 RepID=UPI001B8CEE21|nr:carboxylate-amine ligase [Loktanella sp. SALINAS62]MBS1301274.1 carboxylate-amine ligase [Loktanella sp. SALINAS62]